MKISLKQELDVKSRKNSPNDVIVMSLALSHAHSINCKLRRWTLKDVFAGKGRSNERQSWVELWEM